MSYVWVKDTGLCQCCTVPGVREAAAAFTVSIGASDQVTAALTGLYREIIALPSLSNNPQFRLIRLLDAKLKNKMIKRPTSRLLSCVPSAADFSRSYRVWPSSQQAELSGWRRRAVRGAEPGYRGGGGKERSWSSQASCLSQTEGGKGDQPSTSKGSIRRRNAQRTQVMYERVDYCTQRLYNPEVMLHSQQDMRHHTRGCPALMLFCF